MKRLILLSFLLWMLPLLGHAATPLVSERSVVSPGLWWEARRSGNGFDVHVTGPNQLFVVWYTYRENGQPMWYTAQGTMDAQGKLRADWLLHRFNANAHAGFVKAGEMELIRHHSESMTLNWVLGTTQGQWQLKPFDVPGAELSHDRSGIWYDPAQSGFGLSVMERRDLTVSAYYFYDTNGDPTWAFGQTNPSTGELIYRQFRGACPACNQQASTIAAQGTGSLGNEAERLNFTLRSSAVDFPIAWQLSQRRLQQISLSTEQRRADLQLARFDDAASFDRTMRAALLNLAPLPIVQTGVVTSPPPESSAPTSFSSTNLQESGVDEGDLLKSDGQVAYTFAVDQANLQRRNLLRIAPLVPSAGNGIVELALNTEPQPFELARAEIFLHQSHLLTLTSAKTHYFSIGPVGLLPPGGFARGKTHLQLFDRSQAMAPSARWRAVIDGQLVGARRIDDHVYVVTRYTPEITGFNYGATSAGARAANEALLQSTPTAALLPNWRINGGAAQALVSGSQVLLPASADRVIRPDLVVVTRLDLRDPSQQQSLAIMGTIEAVYVSSQHLYLASNRRQPYFDNQLGMIWNGYSATDLHQIKLTSGALQVTGSATVEGYLDRDESRAPLRFSEHAGHLRVVTVGNHFGSLGVNRLSVVANVADANGRLPIVAALPNAQRPAPIGKPNEQLYGSRFLGNRLYAVTFQKIDPLYVIDLANPLDPNIAGSVELPGFSEYLHPLGNDLLLGVGKDAVADSSSAGFSWFQGVQLSLFDVSDPARPRVLQTETYGKRGSESALLRDHHALSVLPTANGWRLGIPMRIHDRVPSWVPVATAATWYEYTESRLQPVEIRSVAGLWRMLQQPPLVTDRYSPGGSVKDDAADNARSMMLGDQMIYVEKGRYWRAPWGVATTPVGPL